MGIHGSGTPEERGNRPARSLSLPILSTCFPLRQTTFSHFLEIHPDWGLTTGTNAQSRAMHCQRTAGIRASRDIPDKNSRETWACDRATVPRGRPSLRVTGRTGAGASRTLNRAASPSGQSGWRPPARLDTILLDGGFDRSGRGLEGGPPTLQLDLIRECRDQELGRNRAAASPGQGRSREECPGPSDHPVVG